MKRRKVIQVAIAESTELYGSSSGFDPHISTSLVALCDDGSIWAKAAYFKNSPAYKWVRVDTQAIELAE